MNKPLTMTESEEASLRAAYDEDCDTGDVLMELDAVRAALAAAEAKLASYERQCVIRKGHEVEDVMAHGDKVLCTTELVAQLFKDRIEAEAKLADERKQHAITTFILEDERRHADDVAAGAELGGEFRLRVIAIHAARRAAEVGNG